MVATSHRVAEAGGGLERPPHQRHGNVAELDHVDLDTEDLGDEFRGERLVGLAVGDDAAFFED